jgi:hypothetical protein
MQRQHTLRGGNNHRKVEHRTGPATRELAPLKKSIYSLIDLREILLGCNRRYIAHLSALDDVSAGIRALGRLSKPREVDGKGLSPDNRITRLAALGRWCSSTRHERNVV